MFHAIKKKMAQYDPYGIMRVNAAQATVVVIGIVFVDGLYGLPGFSSAITLPIMALIITGTTFGYYPRLKGVLLFCLASIIYTAFFCCVKNYISLLVLATGIGVASLFALSRKFYPPFLGMIALIQVVASVLSQTPNSGDLYQIGRIILDLLAMMALCISFMYFFPKIYFFRIWKRTLYLTLKEFNTQLKRINLNQVNVRNLLLTHLPHLFSLTGNLSYQENGIIARRLVLILTKMYTSLAALVNETISIESTELDLLITVCHEFCIALKHDIPCHPACLLDSDNIHFHILKKNLNSAIEIWNKLCLKN